jgi:hypothetical protein
MLVGNKNINKCEQEIQLWFESRGLPLSIHYRLSGYFKGLLRDSLCIPTKPISDLQRRELYNNIFSFPESRNFFYGDNLTDDDLRSFFSPLSDRDKMPKDDWGG